MATKYVDLIHIVEILRWTLNSFEPDRFRVGLASFDFIEDFSRKIRNPWVNRLYLRRLRKCFYIHFRSMPENAYAEVVKEKAYV